MTESYHSVMFIGNLQKTDGKNSLDCLSIPLRFCYFCFAQLQYLMKHADAKELELCDELQPGLGLVFVFFLFVAMLIIFKSKEA